MNTREEWLAVAGQKIMDDLLAPHGALLGKPVKWSVSCGWPSSRALSNARRRLGECWDLKACVDGATNHIFISPVLSEPVDGSGGGVLPTLVHELIHVLAYEDGHKKRFKQIALAVGLEGKMTATVAGKELCEKLAAIANQLGPYPHSALTALVRKKPQSTRMIKCEAVKCCGFVVRTTRKWLDEVGMPKCTHGSPMVEVT
jgi:hypothetical protein